MKKFYRVFRILFCMIALSGCLMDGVNEGSMIRQLTREQNDVPTASSTPEIQKKMPVISVEETPEKTDFSMMDSAAILNAAQQAEVSQTISADNAGWLSADAFTHGGYVYNTLDNAGKTAYRNLLYGLVNRHYAILQASDNNAVNRIFQQIMADHPELFYVNGYSGVKVRKNDGTICYLTAGQYTCTGDEQTVIQSQIDNAVNEFLNDLPDGDDFAKAEYLVSVLAANTKADETDVSSKQTIVSVFLQHNSVCAGYARAFQYLCQKIGIECTEVSGEVTLSGYAGTPNHAWNLVKLDGDYYYVDPMWSDPETSDHVSDFSYPWMIYDYMFITSADMNLTRRISDLFVLPECTAVKDNWFVRNGSYFQAYNRKNCGAILERDMSAGKHESCFRFSSDDVYQSALKDLVKDGSAMKYLGVRKMLYTSNDAMKTITILF